MPEEKQLDNSPMEVIASKELKVLYSWSAPARPFKKRDKEFWTTVLAIVFLVSLILVFVKEFFLIAAVISLVFVYYVLSTVEPEKIEHKITNKGIVFAGQNYPWEALSQFWFSEKYGSKVINFELKEGLVGRLTLLLGEAEEKRVKEILLKYLIEEEATPNFMDKASVWLGKKVVLESEKKAPQPLQK